MVLTQLPRRVVIAPPVTTTVTWVKDRVCPAVPVNLTMLPVRVVVQSVQIRRTLVTKEETALASIVPRGGRPPVAVPNAKRAVRGRSAMVAKIAHWGLQEKEMTLIRRSADNVNWVKQHRLKVPLNAILVTLVNLAVATVFVLPVPLVFIKMSKVKKSVLNVKQENCTSMLKRLVVGVI
jgi:hypothetical protein